VAAAAEMFGDGRNVDRALAVQADAPAAIGQLVEEEMPDLVHETAVSWFVSELRAWVIALGGFVFPSEAKFAVAPRTGRKPDVTAFLPGQRRLPARGAVRIPPDIAIEVVSPRPRDGRRDRIDKTRDYAAFGVRSYWIVDPAQRSLEILELGSDARYVVALTASEGRIETVSGCEGLKLDLDALWRETDRLEGVDSEE